MILVSYTTPEAHGGCNFCGRGHDHILEIWRVRSEFGTEVRFCGACFHEMEQKVKKVRAQ